MKKSMSGGVLCENKKCKNFHPGCVGNCEKYGSVKQSLAFKEVTKKVKKCKESK
ncbi:MAG: hypothetical protein KAS66_00210 [Candidatus Omnitrophica bacterium]|nr:hypothetical protein [Candidatus Omnitrophota bacterium]